MKRALFIAHAFALPFTSQAQDKYLDDQGRGLTREQAEAANLPLPWRNIVSISPDGHWLLCSRHYGSHWQENYLYRSDDGVQFVPAQELIVAGGAEKLVASRLQKTARLANRREVTCAAGVSAHGSDATWRRSRKPACRTNADGRLSSCQ